MYRNGILEDEGFPVDKVSDYLADPTAVVWFDMCEPTAEDLSQISEELGLHPLAVEDAVAEHQRAKLDRYQSHIFVTSYGVKLNLTPVSWRPTRSTRSSPTAPWSPCGAARASTSTPSCAAGTAHRPG